MQQAWTLPREKVLTRKEVKRVLDRALETEARDYVFFATAANTGLRLCEVVHLRADDLQNGQLRVTRRKKRVLRPEIIDLVPGVWDLLSEWAQMFDEWLFPGLAGPCIIKRRNGTTEHACEGGHISRRVLQRRWELLLADVGLRMRGRGIHMLRHYGITEFYAKHRDLRAAQIYAGHSSSMMTERYAHVVDLGEKIKAMEATL